MKQIFIIGLCVLMVCSVSSAQEEWMPDPNLRQAVRDALELSTDSPLTKEKMQQLTYLEKQNNGIRNINTFANLSGSNLI